MEQENTIAPQQSTTFIKDAVNSTHLPGNKSTLLVYPNPANQEVYLQTQAVIEEVEVYNLQGQILMQKTDSNRIATSHLDAGTYLVKVWTNQGFYVKRFSIMR